MTAKLVNSTPICITFITEDIIFFTFHQNFMAYHGTNKSSKQLGRFFNECRCSMFDKKVSASKSP